MAKENMKIWDALGKTDPAHTKQFTRAGGFKGTAVKPMWANKQMTEFFGPCGVGWGQTEPQFQVVPASDEILVYCTVGLWYIAGDTFSKLVYGVGGDKVMTQIFAKDGQGNKIRGEDGKFKTYPQTDDEAFKKAYTDALSNAMKFIGVAADVHMGLFDDNKYVQSVRAEFEEEKKAEVIAEVEKQKTSPTLDSAPELDWNYNKASGVLICRILDAQKKAKKDGSGEYVALQLNNELDKGKKPVVFYWHATHREQLLAAKGKIAKLIISQKEKGFTVDAVMEIDGEKVATEEPKPFTETAARLLASTMNFEEEELRELHALCNADWGAVLVALRARKAEVEAGVEVGGR
jgi:hypothetical protein